MNISIPDDLRAELDIQVETRGYGSSSEYVRDLIRRDLHRQRLRSLLIEGQQSEHGSPVTGNTLEKLRRRARAVAQLR